MYYHDHPSTLVMVAPTPAQPPEEDRVGVTPSLSILWVSRILCYMYGLVVQVDANLIPKPLHSFAACTVKSAGRPGIFYHVHYIEGGEIL